MMPYKAQVSNTSRLGATRIADPVGCESSVYTAETAISFKEKFIQLTALPFALLVHRALGFLGPSMPY